MSDRPKQYLLLVDDYGKGILGAIIPSLQYVEIEGMEIKEMTHKMVLVTPNPKEKSPEVEVLPKGDVMVSPEVTEVQDQEV